MNGNNGAEKVSQALGLVEKSGSLPGFMGSGGWEMTEDNVQSLYSECTFWLLARNAES